jgi:hypothetical protein
MMENTPSPVQKPLRSSALRAFGRGLRLPVVLTLTLLAASPRAHLSEVATANAAPVPAPAAVPAVVPANVPAPQAVPAVVTPAVAFAKDVEGLSPQVLAMALDAVSCARARGVSGGGDLLTIIDYSLPSTAPRLWVLDLKHGEVLFHELVAHGRGSGDNYATRFSNLDDSHQTSLGLYLTGGTYEGGNGYSLVLKGLDAGVNDRAEERHIVMHGAWYVSAEQARQQGRLGRSWGCPALSEASAHRVIDTIKGGTFVFAYAGEKSWLKTAANSMQSCGAGAGSSTIATAASH